MVESIYNELGINAANDYVSKLESNHLENLTEQHILKRIRTKICGCPSCIMDERIAKKNLLLENWRVHKGNITEETMEAFIEFETEFIDFDNLNSKQDENNLDLLGKIE